MQQTLTRPTAESSNTEHLWIGECQEVSATLAPVVTVIRQDEGTILRAFGSDLHLKLSAEQTSGALTVFLSTIPPGGGPPPHVHRNEDEMFLVIEGLFRFLNNEQWTGPCGPGTLVYAPRGSCHSFQNVGDAPGCFWTILTPSGFEQFFARCADVFAQSGPPDMAHIVAISTEHGIEYVPPLGPPSAAA